MKKKKVIVTKDYITYLKDRISDLEKEKNDIREDREKFRVYFLGLLKQNVSMASKREYYGPEEMINQLSKLMNNVKGWYW